MTKLQSFPHRAPLTRCWLRVTHVGFGRPDQQRTLAVFAEDVGNGVDLLGVTSLGAGPMGLYVGHRGRVDAGLGVDLLQQLLLHLSRWEGDTCQQHYTLTHSHIC